MGTTIAVKSETLDLLRHMKDELDVENLDQTIMKLILNSKKPKTSMFGHIKNLNKEFQREKNDRFD